MPLIDLKIPAGVVRQGVEMESEGRYYDANLVRWRNDNLRPVGGWTGYEIGATGNDVTLTDGVDPVVARGCHMWVDNSGNAWAAFGTSDFLFIMDDDGALTDITPAGFTAGNGTAAENLGYGGKAYGIQAYGVQRDPNGVLVGATTWSMDNFGEDLVGCSTFDGKIYYWDTSVGVGTAAALIANAPTLCQSIIVTQERFLMAFGAQGNKRLVQWSDREDVNLWTPASTNQAGDLELQTEGTIQQAVKIRNRVLILTTTDAHVATYQRPPVVYGIQRVGTGCGAISPKAGVSIGRAAFWMGERAFFIYDGSAVTEIPCTVLDFVFDNLSYNNRGTVHAVANQKYSEIWWFYPDSGSVNPNRYVYFNYRENHWGIGALERSTGFDSGVFQYPLLTGTDGVVYEHEKGPNRQGEIPFAETGPINLGNGDDIAHVMYAVLDERTQGEVEMRFFARYWPDDTEYEYGPYTPSNPTSIRFSGRHFRMRLTGESNGAFRASSVRLDVRSRGNQRSVSR